MEPEVKPKQSDSIFNIYSVVLLESTLQSGREPQKLFSWQQLSPSVLVFKRGAHLLLAFNRLGRSKGLALDSFKFGFAEVRGKGEVWRQGRQEHFSFPQRETHPKGKYVF